MAFGQHSGALEAMWSELLAYVRQGGKVRNHSAQVQPGDVFVALPGTTTDGTQYIPGAVDNGAAWVICAEGSDIPRTTARIVPVSDPQAALGRLAAAMYGTDTRRPKLIGVTGTNGKTTVSYLIEHLLRAAGMRVGVLGTISYRWNGREREAGLTTPGCLDLHAMIAEMTTQGVDAVCMEVSSHALAQNRVAGLDFDLAVFTNLTQDHLDYHQDMETYFAVKSRLFTSYGAISILNLDDPFGRRLTSMGRPGCGYSLSGEGAPGWPSVQGRVERMDRAGQILHMQGPVGEWELRSGLAGRHNASNLLAAQAAGCALGLGPSQLASLESFSGPPGRLERVENSRGLHVFVDYAHTPDALDNVLTALRELDFERLVVVFGCGGDRDPAKRPLMGEAVARYADVAVLTSDNPRHEDPERIMHAVLPGLQNCPRVLQEPDRRTAIRMAVQELGPRDALVIAGKGHEATQQIGDRKIPFKDTQVVLECLA